MCGWVTGEHQRMAVKALLRWVLILPIHRTNVQLKVAPVVCGDVNIYINGLTHGIHLPNHSIAIPSTSLNIGYNVYQLH